MKKIMMTIVFLSTLQSLSFAQIRRAKTVNTNIPSDTTKKIIADTSKSTSKEMLKDMGLSREQMKQLKALKEEGKARKQAIDADTLLSKKERRQKLQQLKDEQLQKMQKFLTPEQMEKMKALLDERVKARLGEKGKGEKE
jgi:Spy/CpxP family protein refolding chaperone